MHEDDAGDAVGGLRLAIAPEGFVGVERHRVKCHDFGPAARADVQVGCGAPDVLDIAPGQNDVASRRRPLLRDGSANRR